MGPTNTPMLLNFAENEIGDWAKDRQEQLLNALKAKQKLVHTYAVIYSFYNYSSVMYRISHRTQVIGNLLIFLKVSFTFDFVNNTFPGPIIFFQFTSNVKAMKFNKIKNK